jgi:hypothetical protein
VACIEACEDEPALVRVHNKNKPILAHVTIFTAMRIGEGSHSRDYITFLVCQLEHKIVYGGQSPPRSHMVVEKRKCQPALVIRQLF